jgi:hypothetical protein
VIGHASGLMQAAKGREHASGRVQRRTGFAQVRETPDLLAACRLVDEQREQGARA